TRPEFWIFTRIEHDLIFDAHPADCLEVLFEGLQLQFELWRISYFHRNKNNVAMVPDHASGFIGQGETYRMVEFLVCCISSEFEMVNTHRGSDNCDEGRAHQQPLS